MHYMIPTVQGALQPVRELAVSDGCKPVAQLLSRCCPIPMPDWFIDPMMQAYELSCPILRPRGVYDDKPNSSSELIWVASFAHGTTQCLCWECN